MKLKPGPKPKSGLEATDVAVWTGSEMLVFGLTSGAYNPAANTWRAIPIGGPDETAVVAWTGHEAIVWGGVCCASSSRDGLAYNPKTNTWRTLPAAPLQPRRFSMGAWTGKELIVAGGFTKTTDGELYFRNAAAYNPATNTWRLLPPMPSRRAGGTALWDGKEVLFIGGDSGSGTLPALSGMAYNPKTNHWRMLPAMQFRRQRVRRGVDRPPGPGLGRAVRPVRRVGDPAARGGLQPGCQPVDGAAASPAARPYGGRRSVDRPHDDRLGRLHPPADHRQDLPRRGGIPSPHTVTGAALAKPPPTGQHRDTAEAFYLLAGSRPRRPAGPAAIVLALPGKPGRPGSGRIRANHLSVIGSRI